MGTVVKTPEVVADLGQIVDHIAADNVSAGLDWLEEIEARFALLSTQPLLGEISRTPRLGVVRRHASGSYAIYYRPIDDGIEVLRVIHSAREQERLI